MEAKISIISLAKKKTPSYFFGNSGDSSMISSKNVNQIKQLEHFSQRSVICINRIITNQNSWQLRTILKIIRVHNIPLRTTCSTSEKTIMPFSPNSLANSLQVNIIIDFICFLEGLYNHWLSKGKKG